MWAKMTALKWLTEHAFLVANSDRVCGRHRRCLRRRAAVHAVLRNCCFFVRYFFLSNNGYQKSGSPEYFTIKYSEFIFGQQIRIEFIRPVCVTILFRLSNHCHLGNK